MARIGLVLVALLVAVSALTPGTVLLAYFKGDYTASIKYGTSYGTIVSLVNGPSWEQTPNSGVNKYKVKGLQSSLSTSCNRTTAYVSFTLYSNTVAFQISDIALQMTPQKSGYASVFFGRNDTCMLPSILCDMDDVNNVQASFPLSGASNQTFIPGRNMSLNVQPNMLSSSGFDVVINYVYINGTLGCLPITPPPFGIVSPSVAYPLHGQGFSFDCAAGYDKSGVDGVSCQQGTWTASTSFTCSLNPTYCTMPTINNGTRGSCTTTIGGACSYSCSPGYTNATQLTAYCTAGATYNFSGTPTCVLYSGFCAAIVPFNGQVALPCATYLGGVCNFTCNAGYGPATTLVACQSSGSFPVVSCVLINPYCPAPPAPVNAVQNSCIQTINGLCLFSCLVGYNTSQSLTRRCQSNAQFNGTDIVCNQIPDFCAFPPAPVNGSVGACSTVLGGVCNFACSPAFTASALSRTCNSSRQFDGTPVVCTLNSGFCAIPAPPQNGFVISCNATLDGKCQLGCQPGYNASNALRQCLLNGNFSGSPTNCTLVSQYCPAPVAPSNAQVGSCVQSVNGICSFTCNPGYTPSGSDWSCNTLGQWAVGTFACSPTPSWCPAPTPSNGALSVCPRTIGTACNITCSPGYAPNAAFATCQLDQTYDVALDCVKITTFCPVPGAYANATVSAPDQSIGGVATVTCNAGFEGGGSLTCGAGAAFTGTVTPCTLISVYCFIPAAPTNGFQLTCDQRLNGACTYSCSPGFNSTGLTRYCQADRSYSTAVGSCVPIQGWCPVPATPDHASMGACATTVGGVCLFSCDTGYQAASSGQSRTCQASGQYDQTDLVCILIDAFCTAPGISFGTVGACATTIGGYCEFSCNTGYSAPAYNLTCAANRQYSPTNMPTCSATPGFCQSPNVANGSLTASCTRQVGQSCTFVCDTGFTPPQTSVTCSLSGGVGVYASAPECLIVNCGPLGQTTPDHGSIACSGSTYGSTCQITCSSGYTLSGTGTRTCSASGTWSGGADASCVADGSATTTAASGGGTATGASGAATTATATATAPASSGDSTNGGAGAITQPAAPPSGGGAAVAGGAAGGAIFLLLLIALIVFLVMRKKLTPKQDAGDNGSATVRSSMTTEDVVKKRIEKMLAAKNTEIIGTGAFAKVYKAKLEEDWVALKVLNEGADQQGRAEFHREATILSRMGVSSHPNVIALRFFCQNPLAMALELAESGSLYAMIRDKQVPWNKHITYANQIAGGMAFLHAREVAHLDLKPENVLLGDQGQLKITDFGCAVIVGTDIARDENGLSLPSQFLGTPQYAGPERFSGKPYSLFKADVYSYAMLVWSMTSGEAPYANQSVENVIESLALNGSNSSKRFSVSPALNNSTLALVVSDGLDAEFSKRPSFAEIAARLSQEEGGQVTVLSHGSMANPAFLDTISSTINSTSQMGSQDHLLQSGTSMASTVV